LVTNGWIIRATIWWGWPWDGRRPQHRRVRSTHQHRHVGPDDLPGAARVTGVAVGEQDRIQRAGVHAQPGQRLAQSRHCGLGSGIDNDGADVPADQQHRYFASETTCSPP